MSKGKGISEILTNPTSGILKNIDKVDSKLDDLDGTLSNIADKSLEKLRNTAEEFTEEVIDAIDRIAKRTETLESTTDKLVNNATIGSSKTVKNIEKGVKALSFKSMINNFKKVFSVANNFSQEAVDYIEDLNLLKVAFGDTADEAKRLVDNIASVTGFDEATLTRNLGTFRNLTSTLGTTNEVADLLAMNLEKMSLDISSLYNVNLDRSAYALTGMLTGQPRTIKTLTGANITQNALQEDLVALGINRNIRELNKAEKAILSYISLEKQLMQSNGDLARTIEQPAQLLRVFREQVSKAARSIGSLLIPTIQAVIPYLTGFLMVFNEIVGTLMTLWGVDADSFWADMTAGAKATAEGIGSVSTAADKAKKGLRNFDKLNVITTPTSGGSSSGTGVGGSLGIDDKLLKALKEYDLHLEKIRTKAVKIKNQTMKLLGFHEELNEETGKWEWKFDGILTTFKNLKDAFLKATPKAKALASFITLITGIAAYNGLSKLVDKFGSSGLGKAISNSLKPTKQLYEYLKLYSNSTGISLGGTIDYWSSQLSVMDKIKTVLVGAGGIVAGLALVKDGVKRIQEESQTLIGSVEAGIGILGSIIGGGLAGASVGGAAGGLIGGIIGGLAGIIKYIDETDTYVNTNLKDIEKLEGEVNKLYSDWQQSVQELQDTYAKANTESDYYQKLWKELQGITDENGKIKKGYEERAEVITTILAEALGIEIKVIDGNIEKWKDLQGEIDNYIIKRKNAIKLSALEQSATEAIKQKAQAEKDLLSAYDERSKAEDNLKDKISDLRTEYSYATDDIYDYIMGLKSADEIAEKYGTTTYAISIGMGDFITNTQKQKKALDKANTAYDKASTSLNGYNQTIKNYEIALGLSLQNKQKALDEFLDHEQYTYGKSLEEQYEYWEERKRINDIGLKHLEETRDEYTKEDYENMKNAYLTGQELAKTQMDKLKLIIDTKTGEISDSMVNQWAEMAENSEKEFITNISNLPNNIKNTLYDKLKEKGVELTKGMQEALNQNTPKVNIEVGAEASKNLNTSISGVVDKIKKSLSNGLSSLTSGNNALSALLGKINFKAEGGFVNSGEIYMARENGMSEYVGRVGHRTAVANNDQIVEGITRGVTNAILSTGGLNSRPVIIKADGDTNGLMSFIRFKQQEDDMQYGD